MKRKEAVDAIRRMTTMVQAFDENYDCTTEIEFVNLLIEGILLVYDREKKKPGLTSSDTEAVPGERAQD
jgi:hypothetical protein